jgi:hypothetical protein
MLLAQRPNMGLGFATPASVQHSTGDDMKWQLFSNLILVGSSM